MSHLLEQLEGRERRAECLRNDESMRRPAPTLACAFQCGWPNDCCQTKARAFFAECEAEARKVMRGAA